ncbi:MAG: hypothetical protein CL946_03910 [Ectothiorhodospiraceae bacterium]|nr:hypothetical protein [Ectothiorhodospiraceae bacterium]
MKRLIISVLVLMCFANLSFAQQMTEHETGQGQQMMDMGKMKKKMKGMNDHMKSGMHSTMYVMMVHHILMKANTLDLTEGQKNELEVIKEKYLYPMVQKEADFKISHMKTMDMLHDPNFDAEKLRSEIKISNQINLDLSDMMIDALTSIRKAIGLDDYEQMIKMMPMMSGGMMKSEEMQKESSSSEHEQHHQNE